MSANFNSQFNSQFDTQRVLDVRTAGDVDHDGNLTRNELRTHGAAISDQLNKIKSGEIVFIADPTPQIQALERDLQITQFMGRNFNAIAGVDGAQTGISANDITTTAAKDGNSSNLNQNDVNLLSPNNGGGGGLGNVIQQFLHLLLQLFQQIFGLFGHAGGGVL